MTEGIRQKTPKKKKKIAEWWHWTGDLLIQALTPYPLLYRGIQFKLMQKVSLILWPGAVSESMKFRVLASNVPKYPTEVSFYLFLSCYSGRLPHLFLNTQNMNHADPRFESCQRVGGRCRKMARIRFMFIDSLRSFYRMIMNSLCMSPYQRILFNS